MPTFKEFFAKVFSNSSKEAISADKADLVDRIDHPEDRVVWNEQEILLTDFTVDKLLGEGTFGSVYLVHDTESSVKYIVKRIRFADDSSAKRFADAIHSWIDLPQNQFLVSCRFARISGHEVDLFLEKFDGTSLADLISTRKLYVENAKACYEKILNIAIQSAWAIAGIHDLDVNHQNVQPNNLYISPQGAVKLTDIGLTRAAASLPLATSADAAPIVPSAYASPEQLADQPVSLPADIWSWGVTVLEMFTGGVKWQAGEPEAYLTWYLNTGPDPEDKNIPLLPAEVADVLRKCFAINPEERWRTASEAAEQLRRIFPTLTGKANPGKTPPHVHRGVLLGYSHSRWAATGGGKWTDPLQWAVKASRNSGEKRTATIRHTSEDSGTLIGKAMEDLPLYESCKKRFEDLITNGATELLHEFSVLLGEKAFVHVALNDLPAALACFDQSIEILEVKVREEGHAEFANDLGMAYLHRANALFRLGELDAALQIYEKAIGTFEAMVVKEGQKQFTGHLAWVRALRADVRFVAGEDERKLSDQAFQKAIVLKEDANAPFVFQAPRGSKLSAEEQIAKTAEAKQAYTTRIQELRTESDEQFREAKASSTKARDWSRLGQDDVRTCIKLLKAEVKRTNRDDIKGILHWAETHFDGRL
jgi:serine/threonine protein kinase